MSKSPYITMNKLAEFTTASATRRKAIIKSLKEESDFKAHYYQAVKAVFNKYLRSAYDATVISDAITQLRKKPIASNWAKADTANSILALQSLLKIEMPDLTKFKVISTFNNIDSITLADVKVLIRPDVYLKHKTTDKIGGVKFHLAKTEKNRLNDDAMKYAAILLKKGLIDHGHDLKLIDNNACLSIEIFGQNYASSPTAFVRSLNELEVSCEEIASRWDDI
jgi:hypothetical protein